MYIQHKLPNIHIITRPLNRSKAKLDFLYSNGGSWFEKPQHRGKKHLLEHCIASRTSKFNFEELKNYTFQENIDLNAYTSDMVMALNASGHCSDVQKMIDILLEMFITPTFDESILLREREVVLRETSEYRGDPNYRLYFDTVRQIFTEDSLEPFDVLGNPDFVAQTTLADFEELHQQNLSTSHLFFMFSGGGLPDDEDIVSQIDASLQNNEQARKLITNTTDLSAINFHPKNQLQEFSFKPIVHTLAHEHADLTIFVPLPITYENSPAIVIFDNLFMKYGGTLHDILRDELQLIYSISGAFRQDMNMLQMNCSCEIHNVLPIVDNIKRALSNSQKYLPIQRFEVFKKLIHKKIEMAADSLGSETKFISERLLNYGKVETYNQYLERLNAVTYEDVLEIYNHFQQGYEQRKITIVSNKLEIEHLKLS